MRHGDITFAITVSVVAFQEKRHKSDFRCHVVFRVLLLYRLYFLAYAYIPHFDRVHDTKPLFEMHKVKHGIDTAAYLQDYVLGALVVYNEVAAFRVVTEQADELVKIVLDIRVVVLELACETADLVDKHYAFLDYVRGKQKVTFLELLRPFLAAYAYRD